MNTVSRWHTLTCFCSIILSVLRPPQLASDVGTHKLCRAQEPSERASHLEQSVVTKLHCVSQFSSQGLIFRGQHVDVDAQALVQLEKECASISHHWFYSLALSVVRAAACGPNHWTTKLLSILICEAILNLEACLTDMTLLHVLAALVSQLTGCFG